MKRKTSTQVLGADSWFADDLDQYETLLERIQWNCYGARYLDGWVIRRRWSR